MEETQVYREDLIGLRTLNETKKLLTHLRKKRKHLEYRISDIITEAFWMLAEVCHKPL